MPAKNTPYLISYYPRHPATPWKLEFRASFAGKRIKRFFESKAEAETTGPLLVAQIRAQGTAALAEQKPSGPPLSAIREEVLQQLGLATFGISRWAYKKQLIEHNIVERVDSPTPQTRLHILTPDQMQASKEI